VTLCGRRIRSECSSAKISVAVSGHDLVAKIQDDGRGFIHGQQRGPAAAAERGGHGLKNMGNRAKELGGRLEINSTPSRGTRLTLSVPVKTS